jgi:hypothetical protein
MKTIASELCSASTLASTLSGRLERFLSPLLVRLDQVLDRRLVQTFAATLSILLEQRYRASGLLLSELGAFLGGFGHAPAGTKRLSNLLRSPRWRATLLEDFLWSAAQRQLMDLVCRGREALLLWDESVWEKPESIALEGLGSVRSAQAARLKRIKKGFYTPPGPPVFVPGMQWLSLLLMGRSGPPVLARMRWWTTRGPRAEEKRSVETSLLEQCASAWGAMVLHVFDRGFAGAPWLEALACARVRFVVRWPRRLHLQDLLGQEAPAWQHARGRKTRSRRQIWDAHHHLWRSGGVLALPVRHPVYPVPLWLVVSRRGKGQEPWYLLTNEPAETPKQMWQVVFAYARRWQIEMAFRFTKSELALESPRLWFWDNRLKLLQMVSLAYAFLLSLLDPELKELRDALLKAFCPRTGKRSRDASTPLYRLRTAICFLCLSLRTPLLPQLQSSG